MSKQNNSNEPDQTLHPHVVVMDVPQNPRAGIVEPLAPRVIATEQTGRIVASAPLEPPLAMAALGRQRRYSLTIRLGLTGLIAAFCGWLGVDLYQWISSAFSYSSELGWAAIAAAATGITAAGAIIAHEMRSYLALKNVEANQQHMGRRGKICGLPTHRRRSSR